MIYWVSPEQIKMCTHVVFKIYEHTNSIIDGDWDKEKSPFEDATMFYSSFKRRLAGDEWKDIEYYHHNANLISQGEIRWGCSTADEFLNRCKGLDKIYTNIKEFGFCQTDINDFISVAVDRDGQLLLCNGRHRLTFAKLLKLEAIPIKIIVRHTKWVEFCEQVKGYTNVPGRGGKIYAPIDHPEFTHWPIRHTGRSSIIIDHMLPSGKTVLDIGTHWGYFPTILERLGKKCVGVENLGEQLFFLHKLKKANDAEFEIVSDDIFNYIGEGKKFDTVLALAIFHHFLKTKELHSKLVNLLRSLEMKEMFLLTHSENEPQMRHAYVDYAPEGFAEFITKHSCLDAYHEIADFNGRKLFHIFQSKNADLYPQPINDFRIIFVAFVNATYPQIFKKVDGQIRGLKANHPNSHCIVLGTGDDSVDTSTYDFDFIDLRNFENGYAQRGVIAAQMLKRLSPDVIYMRYPPADAGIEFITRNFKNILFEHQTIELDELIKTNPNAFINELAFGTTCIQRGLGGVGVTSEIVNYERRRASKSKSYRVMGNGIDEKALPLSKQPEKTGKIHALCVAHYNHWHGLDRLIKGCGNSPEIAEKFRFHVIGDGPALHEYKTLVAKLNVGDTFVFHGRKDKSEIDPYADLSCFAVGSLAFFRNNLKQIAALKHREYALRGLPIMFADEDVDFNRSMEFCHIISHDESPVDMLSLLDFAQKCRKNPLLRLHIREYALKELNWTKKMKTVVEVARRALERDIFNKNHQ
ncbi:MULTISPECIES: glycosyltransferase [unclassified Maridesulfovibrio]|uniref:glycosyltransferase n=1 Tax=unclassified Maridesulfovibrio TaxID=2794999 RepID=UPI003B421CF9